ncbi:MAG: hypothetical protein LBC63_08185 [Holophagales bacterium]|jgi:hypothetical protein|nr:hypothetical protein [Holophagales bacterium]
MSENQDNEQSSAVGLGEKLYEMLGEEQLEKLREKVREELRVEIPKKFERELDEDETKWFVDVTTNKRYFAVMPNEELVSLLAKSLGEKIVKYRVDFLRKFDMESYESEPFMLFDWASRYDAVFTDEPNEFVSKKYDFDSFLKILSNQKELALILPKNAIASVLKTTKQIIEDECKTYELQTVATNYWNSFDEKEQTSAPTFKEQIEFCDACLKNLAKFQDSLNVFPDLLVKNYPWKRTTLLEMAGPHLEEIKVTLEMLMQKAISYRNMQKEASANHLPKSINNAPYRNQPRNRYFDLMFGIWNILHLEFQEEDSPPYTIPKKHAHHIARVIELWRLGRTSDIRTLDKSLNEDWPHEDWKYEEFKAAVGWRGGCSVKKKTSGKNDPMKRK